jgi:RNA polymerase sigma factor (sigma-70 family)
LSRVRFSLVQEADAVLEQNALDVPPSPDDKPRDATEQARTAKTVPVKEPPAADDVEALYNEHRTLLLFIACRKFRIPDCDSENLIQDVFLSYLQTGTTIENVRAWLVAAMCNASRHYWRAQGRTESLPEDYTDRLDPNSAGLAETFALQMTIHQALNYLTEKCRDTLHLHYFEGRSAVEVAVELETTPRYAEKLIHNCLQRVRAIYMDITAVKKK